MDGLIRALCLWQHGRFLAVGKVAFFTTDVLPAPFAAGGSSDYPRRGRAGAVDCGARDAFEPGFDSA